MKIMTFNTQHCFNFVEKKIDYNIMAKAIKSCGADIIGLNEMRSKGIDPEYKDQASILSEITKIKHHYFAEAIRIGGENPYGNAILSKFPIISAETIIIPDPINRKYNGYYETRCILKAKLECGITVLVTHFGLNPDEQENAVKTVLENIAHEKCILMGDFNVRPDNKVLTPIRERMKDVADFFDAPLHSFPSDHPDRKIDYVFVSRDIEVIEADIPSIISSDHRPHTATIKIPGI